jgi:hypothetical protein
VLAAAQTIDDASDEQDERVELWRRLCGGVLVSALTEADDATRASIAERLNKGLEAKGVPWRLVLQAG